MTCTPRRLWLSHALGLVTGLAAALALLFVLSLVLGLVPSKDSALRDGAGWLLLGLGMQASALLAGLVVYQAALARVTGLRLDRSGRRAAQLLAYGGAFGAVALIYKGFVAPAEAVIVLLALWFAAGGWLLMRAHAKACSSDGW